MCFSGLAPKLPAPPPPPPMLPDAKIQGAGANQRTKAFGATGPMSTIMNSGGALGLVTPPQTTNKAMLGG